MAHINANKPFQIPEKAITLSSTLRVSLFQEILFKVLGLQFSTCAFVPSFDGMQTAGEPSDPCSTSLNSLLCPRAVFASTNRTILSEHHALILESVFSYEIKL